jgi:hypothetical protein
MRPSSQFSESVRSLVGDDEFARMASCASKSVHVFPRGRAKDQRPIRNLAVAIRFQLRDPSILDLIKQLDGTRVRE